MMTREESPDVYKALNGHTEPVNRRISRTCASSYRDSTSGPEVPSAPNFRDLVAFVLPNADQPDADPADLNTGDRAENVMPATEATSIQTAFWGCS